MNDRLLALKLFSRVARTGSFSRTARELNLSQPSVSRIIAELEQEIGVTLLTRTTRALTLTEAGADYLARIDPILVSLEEADYAARGTGEIRGQLRVGVSSSFAVREIIPRLPTFMEKHPALRVDLLMSDQREDLITGGVDVALRFGKLNDSNAMARLIGLSPRVLLASPDYLARMGTPQTPADLPAHAVIAGPTGIGSKGWSFEKDGRSLSVRVEGRLSISVNEGSIAAAVAGLGIVMTARWGCRAELENGTLVQVLSDWQMTPLEVHAVFPAGRAAKPSARALIDHLAATLN